MHIIIPYDIELFHSSFDYIILTYVITNQYKNNTEKTCKNSTLFLKFLFVS